MARPYLIPWRVRVVNVVWVEPVVTPIFNICIDIIHNILVSLLLANNMFMIFFLPAKFYVLLFRGSGDCALYLSNYYGQSAVVVKIFVF